jgi:hypothetical protein
MGIATRRPSALIRRILEPAGPAVNLAPPDGQGVIPGAGEAPAHIPLPASNARADTNGRSVTCDVTIRAGRLAQRKTPCRDRRPLSSAGQPPRRSRTSQRLSLATAPVQSHGRDWECSRDADVPLPSLRCSCLRRLRTRRTRHHQRCAQLSVVRTGAARDARSWRVQRRGNFAV